MFLSCCLISGDGEENQESEECPYAVGWRAVGTRPVCRDCHAKRTGAHVEEA
jgi:hypothetical protein